MYIYLYIYIYAYTCIYIYTDRLTPNDRCGGTRDWRGARYAPVAGALVRELKEDEPSFSFLSFYCDVCS